MLIKALKSKIHRATVSDTKLDYPGSVAVDSTLMEAVGIAPYEAVLLANVSNGARVETYVIPAPADNGEFSVLGAAAKMFEAGDIVIVLNFGLFSPDEMKEHKPKVIAVDENNKITRFL